MFVVLITRLNRPTDQFFYCESEDSQQCTDINQATKFDKVGADIISTNGLPFDSIFYSRRLIKV